MNSCCYGMMCCPKIKKYFVAYAMESTSCYYTTRIKKDWFKKGCFVVKSGGAGKIKPKAHGFVPLRYIWGTNLFEQPWSINRRNSIKSYQLLKRTPTA